MPGYKEKICQKCKKTYLVHPKGSFKSKYCSKECQALVTQSTERQYERMNAEGTPHRYIKTLLSHSNRKCLSSADILDLLEEQHGKCALTGIKMTYKRELGTRLATNISIDRIEAGGPYIKENIRLVCAIVNKMRLDMEDSELKFWCKKILEN